MRIGVVGAGYWGPNLIRNFYEIGVLKAVCDKDEEKLKKLKRKYPDVKFFTDISDFFEEVEAVAVAVDAKHHYDIAKKSLEEDKDVFVEKPLALTSKQCEELIKLAERKNKILMVGHLLVYHPVVRRLKKLIEDGEIGDILYLYSQRVNLGRVRVDENALWSFGVHDISVFIYLLSKFPQKVVASGMSYLTEGVEDVVFCTLYFPDKVIGHLHVSWLDPHKIRRITIVGTKKMAVFDDVDPQNKLIIYDKGVDYKPEVVPFEKALSLRIGDIYIPKIEMKEPLRVECEHFLECVRERKKPMTDGTEGLKVVKILESAQKSLIEKRAVNCEIS